MRNFVSILLFLLIVSFPLSNFAFAESSSFDASQICPLPPQENSPQFELDKKLYQQGKLLHSTERGKIAAEDAELTNYPKHFSKAVGFEISKTNSPALFNLLNFVHQQIADEINKKLKLMHNRTRPFVLYNEHTCRPDYEESLKNTSSYPSGHSARGWSIALVLAEILPNCSTQIINRGYELGQSRVICGYHWQSDVEAARIVAAAFVANLHTRQDFQELFQKAKEELRKK